MLDALHVAGTTIAIIGGIVGLGYLWKLALTGLWNWSGDGR